MKQEDLLVYNPKDVKIFLILYWILSNIPTDFEHAQYSNAESAYYEVDIDGKFLSNFLLLSRTNWFFPIFTDMFKIVPNT